MKRIVLIAAGGHGREVADIVVDQARAGEEVTLLGFVDDDPAKHGTSMNGWPVLGGWGWFDGVDRSQIEVICCVGTPSLQRRLVQRAKDAGLRFGSAVSPSTFVSPHAKLGEGVMIFPMVSIHANVEIGAHTIVNVAASISHDCRVGPHCNVNPGARLAGNVTAGEGSFIGMGAHVIQGMTIGEWSVVGACAAVVRPLPARVTAVGVPARVIKTR